MAFSRREFITTAVLGSLSLSVDAQEPKEKASKVRQTMTTGPYPRPVIICAANGLNYLDDAYTLLRGGSDTLDAALRVVRGLEDDPNDDSVGLGGLPNEEGVVELDACCMHGPTRRAGSVGGVRNIKNVSLVAKAVMEHTGHVMLVGEGAERFAVAMGFSRENLLTERSRKVWMLWKEYHSTDDWWGPGLADPHFQPPTSSPHSELWPERLRKLERWPRESALNQNFVIQQFGGFYSLPPARFIAQLSLKEERFPDALQPADSPLSSPDASAIHPSSAPDATPTRMSARRARPAEEQRTSRLPERIRLSRTCATGCRHSTPALTR